MRGQTLPHLREPVLLVVCRGRVELAVRMPPSECTLVRQRLLYVQLTSLRPYPQCFTMVLGQAG